MNENNNSEKYCRFIFVEFLNQIIVTCVAHGIEIRHHTFICITAIINTYKLCQKQIELNQNILTLNKNNFVNS